MQAVSKQRMSPGFACTAAALECLESNLHLMIVAKFGGTSIGTAERMLLVSQITKNIASPLVIVLSATSSNLKSEGTTSRLLHASEDILLPNSSLYLDIIDSVEQSHLNIIHNAIQQQSIANHASDWVRSQCNKLKSFMAAAEIIDEISPRSRDVILSAGEKLSAYIFTNILKDAGMNAQYVSLDTLINRKFTTPLAPDFYSYCVAQIKDALAHWSKDCVLVVTGYFGPVPGGILNAIGRGYTDLTAALVAIALNASELQIWKEVDGIFTADPRKVPRARLLPTISPNEAAELTYYGSEVIHPFTMDQVIHARIPIRIKNTFKPEGCGTIIQPDHPDGARQSAEGARPTAVTLKENILVVNVKSNKRFGAVILETSLMVLDHFGIIVDLISTSEVHVSMALSPNSIDSIDNVVSELQEFGKVDVMKDMTIVSLVGSQMRHMVGVAALMFGTLAKFDINLEMISQGASEINISCVVSGKKGQEALRVIHDACILGEEPK